MMLFATYQRQIYISFGEPKYKIFDRGIDIIIMLFRLIYDAVI